VKLSSDLKKNPLDEWGVDFIHTPGHTPGHTSFMHIASKTLFSGSGLSLFKNNTLGIVPVFYDRTAQIESAKKLQKAGFRYLYPAHMQLFAGEINHKEIIPFDGRIPFLFRLAGTLPLFRCTLKG
jgi:glyoxylase-like metal-dependent hydrolase (beta-lactamase superfamily II)